MFATHINALFHRLFVSNAFNDSSPIGYSVVIIILPMCSVLHHPAESGTVAPFFNVAYTVSSLNFPA